MNGMQLFCYSEMIHRSMVYIVTGVVYTCYIAVVCQYWSTRILIVFQLELSSLRYNVARSMFSAFDLIFDIFIIMQIPPYCIMQISNKVIVHEVCTQVCFNWC